MTTDLPSYAELPDGSSWGLWGPDDVFGCLNLLTPERVRRGAACVRKGAVFPLNAELELPDPPLFSWRTPPAHEVTWLENQIGHDDRLDAWNTQSSTQWDGFRHIRNPVHGFYGGIRDEDHGMHHWARRGIAGRAMLADVARYREAAGRPIDPGTADPIEPEDLLGALDAQGVGVEPGDILLVRTGWLAWYRSLDRDGRERAATSFAATGLRPGRRTARVLWDLHPAAVAADNPALEVWPPAALATPEQIEAIREDRSNLGEVFMHVLLLPLLGLPIGELWDLDALADDCAADGVYECFLTSAPLNLLGGAGSPANALAVK